MLKELIIVLKIPYDGTIDFQYQKLTLSDVYGKWVAMQLHLKLFVSKKQFKTKLSNHLLKALEKRNENVFKNPLMTCALYLDPRYRMAVISSREKTEQAKSMLMKISRRIRAIESAQNESISNQSNEISSDSLNLDFDEQKAISEHFNLNQNTNISMNVDIETIIDMFSPELMPVNSSVLEFWESMKENESQLYKLAMVVFSVPPTEVQIERDFSRLKFIFSDRRHSLTQQRLEEILLLHFNKDLFYEVNKEKINELCD